MRLLRSKLLPHQGATVAVQVEGNNPPKEPQALLLESNQDAALQVQDCLIQVQEDHSTHVQVFNPTGFSCHSEAGTEPGEAMEAELVVVEQHPTEAMSQEDSTPTAIRRVT